MGCHGGAVGQLSPLSFRSPVSPPGFSWETFSFSGWMCFGCWKEVIAAAVAWLLHVSFLRMKDLETNLKLAALGCVNDHKAGEMYVADYILYHLNRMRRFDYVRVLGLPGPSNDIHEVREVYTPARLGVTEPDRGVECVHADMWWRGGGKGRLTLLSSFRLLAYRCLQPLLGSICPVVE